jgi:ArsR family transcriptional regulator
MILKKMLEYMSTCSYIMHKRGNNMRSEKNNELCEIACVDEVKVNKIMKEMLSKNTLSDLAEIFKAMGDHTRISILHALSKNELCVCDMASLLGVSQSALSHQLRVLRNLRIVKFRKEGKIVYYSLDDKHIKNLLNEGFKHVTEDV